MWNFKSEAADMTATLKRKVCSMVAEAYYEGVMLGIKEVDVALKHNDDSKLGQALVKARKRLVVASGKYSKEYNQG
jgi:hypothetical protein